jgi:CRISPR/Cas system-associated endoribonuclease Cas2
MITLKMIYLITYDLNTEGKDYNALYDKIKSLGQWFHPLESVWFLQSSLYGVDTISEQLRTVMDNNDHILVVNITNQSHQGWLPKTAWEWLREHK